MLADLLSLIDQTTHTLSEQLKPDGLTDREAIQEISYILRGPAAGRIMVETEAVKKKEPGAKEIEAIICQALKTLEKRDKAPSPSDYIILDELHGLFDGPKCRAALQRAGR